MKAIYEPKGPAAEYARYALNTYRGCAHRCRYCYAPRVLHMSKEEFWRPYPRWSRPQLKEILDSDCKSLLEAPGYKGDPVMLSFTTDPLQPLEDSEGLSRVAIEVLKTHGIPVKLLTKGFPPGANNVLDMLDERDWFGVTLTMTRDNPCRHRYWEPGAPLNERRLELLREAANKDICTWVSFEPVLYPEDALKLIEDVSFFVDEIYVGKLNYLPEANRVNWMYFGREVESLCRKLNMKYTIKAELRNEMSGRQS